MEKLAQSALRGAVVSVDYSGRFQAFAGGIYVHVHAAGDALRHVEKDLAFFRCFPDDRDEPVF